MLHSLDFHSHSNASDGDLSPMDLVQKAYDVGVRFFALTDHDTVEGCLLLEKQTLPADLTFINGAEFTCVLGKQVLHVVGLNLNIRNTALSNHLEYMTRLREERALKIDERLQKMQLPSLIEAARAHAGGAQLGRPHFAKALIEAGVVDSEAKAFKKYLGAGKPGDVKVAWPTLEEVLKIIKDAGGVSVLAHPTKYNLTLNKIRGVVSEFASLGGQAIEVGYPGVTQDQQASLMMLARKFELALSGGSDFHSPEQLWTSIGCYPDFAHSGNHISGLIGIDYPSGRSA
jgi:predicted metal-dependent phosphoesterase TrpH